MSDRIKEMIGEILAAEGGYVNHPADRGGPTNRGVTQRALSRHRGMAATVTDVKALTVREAEEIYRIDYYVRPGMDRLPEEVQPFVFDCGVNHGPRRAIRFVQSVCNQVGLGPIGVDGVMGPRTAKTAREAQDLMGGWFLQALVQERIDFYRAIVRNNPSQGVFLKGWLNRAGKFWNSELGALKEAV